jgi:hypothetical protein
MFNRRVWAQANSDGKRRRKAEPSFECTRAQRDIKRMIVQKPLAELTKGKVSVPFVK